MRRGWARDRLRVVVGVALFVVAVVWAVRLCLLPSAQREGVLQYAEFVVALVGALITVWGRLGDGRAQVHQRPVDTLADLLAEVVRGQWRKEAAERLLVTPTPIPVRWSVSDLAVAGPVNAAVGDPDVAPAFPPLPGH